MLFTSPSLILSKMFLLIKLGGQKSKGDYNTSISQQTHFQSIVLGFC